MTILILKMADDRKTFLFKINKQQIPIFLNREEQLLWWFKQFLQGVSSFYHQINALETEDKVRKLSNSIDDFKTIALTRVQEIVDNCPSELIVDSDKIHTFDVEVQKRLIFPIFIKICLDMSNETDYPKVMDECNNFLKNLFSEERKYDRQVLLKIFGIIIKVLKS